MVVVRFTFGSIVVKAVRRGTGAVAVNLEPRDKYGLVLRIVALGMEALFAAARLRASSWSLEKADAASLPSTFTRSFRLPSSLRSIVFALGDQKDRCHRWQARAKRKVEECRRT